MTPAPTHRQPRGFTLVEVMMAATILVVAFVGMIEATIIGANLMANARRQTLAAQIIAHEIEKLRFASWADISNLPTSAITQNADWSSSTAYYAGDTVTYNNAWYRCILANTGAAPTSTTYWRADTPPYANMMTTGGTALAATYTLTRTVTSPDPATNLREVNFTVTWVVTTNRRAGDSLVTFTYSRSNSAYFGKHGLNLTYQRS